MSSRQLTQTETDILKKGLDSLITFKILANKDIKATNKNAVKDLEKQEADTSRAKTNFTHQNSKNLKDNLNQEAATGGVL